MATVVPSSPLQWLPPLQAQLVSVTGLPVERVNFVIRSNPPMASPQDILIWPSAIINYDPISFGSGRVAPVVTREVRVFLRTRLATDQAEYDDTFLLDASLGHVQMEDLVFGALYDFQPVDGSGNALLSVPLQFKSGPEPLKPEERDIPDLGVSVFTFQAMYELNQAATFATDPINL